MCSHCNWNGIFTLTAIFTFPTDFHIFHIAFFYVCMRLLQTAATITVLLLWISSILKIKLCNCLMCLCYIYIISHFTWFYDWRIYRLNNEGVEKLIWKLEVKKSHQIRIHISTTTERSWIIRQIVWKTMYLTFCCTHWTVYLIWHNELFSHKFFIYSVRLL